MSLHSLLTTNPLSLFGNGHYLPSLTWLMVIGSWKKWTSQSSRPCFCFSAALIFCRTSVTCFDCHTTLCDTLAGSDTDSCQCHWLNLLHRQRTHLQWHIVHKFFFPPCTLFSLQLVELCTKSDMYKIRSALTRGVHSSLSHQQDYFILHFFFVSSRHLKLIRLTWLVMQLHLTSLFFWLVSDVELCRAVR